MSVEDATEPAVEKAVEAEHASLKYSLLGPSLLKAGQDSVDQSKVSEIIYNASRGSKFFNREEVKDKILTEKIARIQAKKADLEALDLSRELRLADAWIEERESSRDLSQRIVHVDCDAFYCAVEQLDRPELADLPFAVGGGVLSTCNYVARRFGCRSGMAGFVAKQLCPDLILIRSNFDKYNAKAAEVRSVLAEYDPRFESASCDEAYLNITQYCADHGLPPEEAVEQMRAEIFLRAKITVSAGIAANARLAKICSNMNKPNGQFSLPVDRPAIMAFMRDLPCRKANGIGRVLERELAAVGVATFGDVYPQRQFLTRLFGEKAFRFLVDCYLGLGRTEVRPAEEYERKSVGTERTFSDMSDPVRLREQLRRTAEELEKDMRRAECRGRTLVLKIKLPSFELLSRQVSLPRPIHLTEDLFNFALPMLARLEKEVPRFSCRLMGLRCTHLVSTKKPDTLAFFGLKTRLLHHAEAGQQQHQQDDDSGGWEQWPEEEFDGFELEPAGEDESAGPQPTAADVEADGTSQLRRHGKEIVPNPKPKEAPAEEEWWDCPICGRPQATDERQFNEHIDLCLSRRTIRDTVQQEAQRALPNPLPAVDSKRIKAAADRKRGRGPGFPDPKQKRICF